MNKIIKYSLIIFFVIFCSNIILSQKYIYREYTNKLNINQIKSFNEIGKNVEIIPKFEKQIVLAMLNYTELKNVKIIFKYGKIKTTMSCIPNISTIRKDQIYEITINDDEEFEGPLLKDIPFNAQIGVIAHEFGHIVDYEGENIIGLLSKGIEYLNITRRPNFEKNVDKITILHGYGWQLYDCSKYIENNKVIPIEYKNFKTENYLNSFEIKEYIEELDMY